ncbi:hypothetical protein ASPZODRAFT_138488 [Penicilliopsis zonata CBS 506.65]|uniref:DNA-directed RNA polymerase I subunit RPA34.5 n=1 Tax=Penicilliopsis zonata CBS 506.65 TaxID=1073090 RepID=A0A1L9SW14_9EURO|nr:hypothetical protein ASPZODRAFT_138488 [Penicilliopsis zonata CBS 506.65]OJJ51390.1 hypothetical protein ASPZODRAFT_138488 [Penicilliopsis zonata CBS 506.65]
MAPTSEMSVDSDSSSSRSSSPEQVSKAKSKKDTREKKSSEIVSEASESSSEAEGSSEESEDETSSNKRPSKSSKLALTPAQAFKPPSGFKSVKKVSPSTNVSSLLANLRGKQILHITAPASLPIAKIKEVSLAKVMAGEPVITHEGVSYGIPPETLVQPEANGKTLLLFNSKTQTYSSTSATNIRSYHLQEIANIQNGKHDEKTILALRDSVKPPRAQPKHMKMRFRPVGSHAAPPETLGSSSESEADDEQPTFKVPKGDERKRKHPHPEIDGSQPIALPRKKSKKQSSSQDNGAPNDQERGHEKAKKLKKNRDETSERKDKKRKKAEKAA